MSVRVERIIIILLLLAALILSVSSMRTINETNDEVPHIAAGYSYLLKGDFRLNAEHPPLIKAFAALPLLFSPPHFDSNDQFWKQSLAWDFGQMFLYSWNSPDRIVLLARLPMIFLYLCLGLLVWHCASTLYNQASGFLALFLALFTPELIAHGQLVTTDLGMTLFGFSSVWFFYRSLTVKRPTDFVLFFMSSGAMATTKFTASIFFLVLFVLAGAYVVLPSSSFEHENVPTRLRRLRSAGWLLLGSVVTTWLIIWAVYGLRYAISPDVEILVPWGDFNQHSIITKTVLFVREYRFLPEGYLAGILECFKMLPDRPTYLFGSILNGGRWYYFPISFLLKTPLPLILLIGLGFFRRTRSDLLSFTTITLLLPPAIYLLIAMQSDVNIGNRHILPIYPFLIVWAAEAGRMVTLERCLNWKRAVLTVLLLWMLVGTVRIYPHYLSYFNELAGGASGGARYLIDSNIDWGQDMKSLAAYRTSKGIDDLYVCYFGTAAPQYYLPGAPLLPCMYNGTTTFAAVPQGATVAISVNHLAGLYLRKNQLAVDFLQKIKGAEPIDRVGYSILIYRMP